MLVHNPKAGDAGHRADALCSLVAEAGYDVTYRSVKDDRWRAALAERPDLVVAAGGDGTVCEVFLALAGTSLPATLLPLGTANNIARTLDLADRDVGSLIHGWAEGEARGFDTGEVSTASKSLGFVESFGGGIFADLIARADDDPRDDDTVDHGLRVLRETIADARSSHWIVEADGTDLSGEYVGIEVMNIREIGPNVALAPKADPGDACLELVRIRPDAVPALLDDVDRRAGGDDAQPPPLAVQRSRQVTLRVSGVSKLHLDDELWPPEREVLDDVVEVTCRRSLTVLVP
jgi:diacylglycerol kinase family enzyme